MLVRIIVFFISLIRNLILSLFRKTIFLVLTFILILSAVFGYFAYKNDFFAFFTDSDSKDDKQVEQSAQSENTWQTSQSLNYNSDVITQNQPYLNFSTGNIDFVDVGMITDSNFFQQHPEITGMNFMKSYQLPYELQGKVDTNKYQLILVSTKKYYGYHLKVISIQEIQPNAYQITVTKESSSSLSVPANTVLAIDQQKVNINVTKFRVVTDTGEQLFPQPK